MSSARRAGRSSQPRQGRGQVAASGTRPLPELSSASDSCPWSPVPCSLCPAAHPAAFGHPGSSETSSRAARLCSGRGNTPVLAEKVSVCWLCWLCDAVLPKCPSCPDLVRLPPSLALPTHPAAQHFLGLFRDGGQNYMGGPENLKCLSKAWVDDSLAVQKS